MTLREGYVAFGSNLGDRFGTIQSAIGMLGSTSEIRVVASSSLYESEPVGTVVDQPDFLNGAVRIETSLEPVPLVRRLHVIEHALGRTRSGFKDGPREIDLDLLLLGDLAGVFRDGEGPETVLPHPLMVERRFVLLPLAELDSRLGLPTGVRVEDAIESLGEGQRVGRVAGPP